MKRSALFLAIAIALGVGGFSTPDARASSETVAMLIADATEINIGGGLQVLFTSYSPTTVNAPTAANITIEWGAGSGSPFSGPGGSVNYGFGVDGNFNTAAGATLDAGLTYTVSSVSGAKVITDAYAFVDATFPGSSTGIASATDTLNLSTGTKAFAASVSVPNLGGTNPSEISFAPQSSIVVHKDIASINFTGATLLSAIQQGYSTQSVPEPASVALLGIGMTGFLAFRRFFKKTSVA